MRYYRLEVFPSRGYDLYQFSPYYPSDVPKAHDRAGGIDYVGQRLMSKQSSTKTPFSNEQRSSLTKNITD